MNETMSLDLKQITVKMANCKTIKLQDEQAGAIDRSRQLPRQAGWQKSVLSFYLLKFLF